MLLRFDLGLRGEARTEQLGADHVAEVGLGQHEEVVIATTQDTQRRDDARLRRQQQRLARLADAERGDVVRDHPLEVVLSVRPGHTDERAGTRRDARHAD